jgi:large subunit ribosomal protein L29
VKAEELRTLDIAELEDRLKAARRELYELRFKLAVGQLENHREIRKARKDIARILTVLHQRRLEGEAVPVGVASPAAESPVSVQETPEHVEASTSGEPGAAQAPDRGAEDPGRPGTDREGDDE